MSVTKLPNGRWRAQVYDPATRKTISAAKVLGGPGSYRTKTDAKQARSRARERLASPRGGITVAAWRDRWLTEPLFARPKQSTMIRHAERTKAFAARYGSVALRDIDDHVVSDWLAGGRARAGCVPSLRAMFNDAASAKAGRLIDRNPWAGLGLEASKGNAEKQPPPEEQVWRMIAAARKHSGPFFAAWLQVAAFTGLRPGELDALRWDRIDLTAGTARIVEQFNAATRTFTAPKNGRARDAILTPPAREALLSLPRQAEFCFVTARGTHYTPSSRSAHWKAARAAAGWTGSLYLATRHFAGWYMVNELELPSEDVAIALGHTDGGELVRRLYGHRDTRRALDRVAQAYERHGNVRPLLRAVESDAG